ncbi:MAG: CDP-diacylglycerol--serine O-phosphatidyltransferase [Bacteroidales bacterium]|nr:CDP-diacylglycerol--serine O-phosphatidyltransferase [Bacteroidales bacterium]
MLKIKNHIPNFITSLNIVSGALSIIFAFEGLITLAAYMILIAAVFDFLDGMMARLLKAYSEMGKQLDSLADMVSFGLAPAIIAYHLMKPSIHIETLYPNNIEVYKLIYLFSVILIPIFSGLRLAKFNIDTRQTNNFIGLPTPANALFYASIPIISSQNPFDPFLFLIFDKVNLLLIIITSSLLLVSPFHMFSFKFKNFKWSENKIRFIFLSLILVVIVLSASQELKFIGSLITEMRILLLIKEFFYILVKALPLIIILYIILSLVNSSFTYFKRKQPSNSL